MHAQMPTLYHSCCRVCAVLVPSAYCIFVFLNQSGILRDGRAAAMERQAAA